MARQEPQSILHIRSRLGRFIRIYPALEAAFSNDNAARVFEMFLYYESDRLTRSADWFTLTDDQGAESSGLSLRQFRDGRDVLCDPFNHLFQRERSTFGISHYRANDDRIHGWLTANGFPETSPPAKSSTQSQTASVHKMYTDRYTKRAPTAIQNDHPTKEKESVRTENSSTPDNRTRASAREAGAAGEQPALEFVLTEAERAVIELFGQIAGVRLNQTTLTIARKLISSGCDLEKLRGIALAEWASIGDRVDNPAGVFISRMRGIDPAKWTPAKRKQQAGKHRREQVDYTDEERSRENERAKERLGAQNVDERIAELQQRISNAQGKCSRPGANIEYWQQYIEQKQRELNALLVPAEGDQ